MNQETAAYTAVNLNTGTLGRGLYYYKLQSRRFLSCEKNDHTINQMK